MLSVAIILNVTQNWTSRFSLPSFSLPGCYLSFIYIHLAAQTFRSCHISSCTCWKSVHVTAHILLWPFWLTVFLPATPALFFLTFTQFHNAGFVSGSMQSPRASPCYECEEMFVCPVMGQRPILSPKSLSDPDFLDKTINFLMPLLDKVTIHSQSRNLHQHLLLTCCKW